MSLTGIAFLLGFLALIGLTLSRGPIYGLYAYLAAFYAHPPSRWWGYGIPDLRWSALAATVTLIAVLRMKTDPHRTPWFKTPPGLILLLYVAWMWIEIPWAVDQKLHMEGTFLFTKYLLLFWMVYTICKSPEDMRKFIIAHLIGCFYLGYLAFNVKVRGRLEGIGGPGINDSNALGMQLSTAVLAGSAFVLSLRGWWQWGVIALMPFVLNGVILTASRGAFLNIIGGGLAIWRVRPKGSAKLFYSFAALGVVLLLVLGHELFWKRVFSIGTAATNVEEADKSAASREVFVHAQLQMFFDRPYGSGFSATMPLSPKYIPAEYLTMTADGQMLRASHNTYMSILVDQGVVGAVLMFVLFVYCYRTIRKLKRLDGLPDVDANVGMLRTAIAAMLMGLAMHALFKNTLKAEVQIWCLALLASLVEHARVHYSVVAGKAAAIAPQLQRAYSFRSSEDAPRLPR
jgi:hypothetical protein